MSGIENEKYAKKEIFEKTDKERERERERERETDRGREREAEIERKKDERALRIILFVNFGKYAFHPIVSLHVSD